AGRDVPTARPPSGQAARGLHVVLPPLAAWAYCRSVVTHPAQLVLWGLVLLAVGTLLRLHLWRALLFVRPGAVRLAETAVPPLSPALLEKSQMLEALGFRKLGAHVESAPL